MGAGGAYVAVLALPGERAGCSAIRGPTNASRGTAAARRLHSRVEGFISDRRRYNGYGIYSSQVTPDRVVTKRFELGPRMPSPSGRAVALQPQA